VPPRKRSVALFPTARDTDAELDAQLEQSVPDAFDPGYEGHKLRISGVPWPEVAKHIGAGTGERAMRVVSAYLQKAAAAQSATNMQEAMQLQLDRYEAIVRAYWSPAIDDRDEKAALVVLRALERLDRLQRLTDGDVAVTKETLVVSADPGEYVKQLQQVVEARTLTRS
jgi:hypothetical protein